MCIGKQKTMSTRGLSSMINVSPLAKKVYQFMLTNGGSISSREAYLDLDITSASLARRITELKRAGYKVEAQRLINPATEKQYTRYVAA
jgi:hypothetical protein